MEIEYKWNMPSAELSERLLSCAQVANHISSHERIHMRATYYDTPNQDVRNMGDGLRIRQENDESVCCLKLSELGADGCKTRREFEVNSADIAEGLRKLAESGAPSGVCETLLEATPEPICATDFMRRAYELAFDDFSAELAIDAGEMSRQDRTAPISEIELEYLDGSEEAFHALALKLQEELGLEVLPLSKLARAATL